MPRALKQVIYGIPKITISNFRKPVHEVIVIPFSTASLNLEVLTRREEIAKIWISQEPKWHFKWIKRILYYILRAFLVKFKKIADLSFEENIDNKIWRSWSKSFSKTAANIFQYCNNHFCKVWFSQMLKWLLK